MNDEEIDSALKQTPEMPFVLAEKIRAQLRVDVKPARPLMRDSTYSLLFLALFAVISVCYAALLKFKGLHILSAQAATELLLSLAVMAVLGSISAARSMRPAAGRLYSWVLTGVALVIYEVLISRLFSDYSTTGFVHDGIVCLGLGVLGGILVATPVWIIVRRGFVVQSVLAGAAIGLVGGLAGLTFLTLHCPLLTVPHAAVWHAAVVLVCATGGAIVGRARLP